jgi:hypothetical protein
LSVSTLAKTSFWDAQKWRKAPYHGLETPARGTSGLYRTINGVDLPDFKSDPAKSGAGTAHTIRPGYIQMGALAPCRMLSHRIGLFISYLDKTAGFSMWQWLINTGTHALNRRLNPRPANKSVLIRNRCLVVFFIFHVTNLFMFVRVVNLNAAAAKCREHRHTQPEQSLFSGRCTNIK